METRNDYFIPWSQLNAILLSFRFLDFYAFQNVPFRVIFQLVSSTRVSSQNYPSTFLFFSAEISTFCRKSFSKGRLKSRESHNYCYKLWLSFWKPTTKHGAIAKDIFWCYETQWESIPNELIYFMILTRHRYFIELQSCPKKLNSSLFEIDKYIQLFERN